MPDRSLESSDEITPVRGRPPRRAEEPLPAARPLGGWLGFLAVATLLFGSCSGLTSGCEAVAHSMTAGAPNANVKLSLGSNEQQFKVPQGTDTTVVSVGVAVRALYTLACLLAVGLAIAVLTKSRGANYRALLAWAAAGLATLRLAITGIDYVLVEQLMEIARSAARRSAGYSYNQTGAALNQMEDFGTTGTMALGMALVTFWAITAVSFWETKQPTATDAVDRLL